MSDLIPRIGWYPLPTAIAKELAEATGLDARRNLYAWGIRWLGYEVIFCVKETGWDEKTQQQISRAVDFFDALQEAERRKDNDPRG